MVLAFIPFVIIILMIHTVPNVIMHANMYASVSIASLILSFILFLHYTGCSVCLCSLLGLLVFVGNSHILVSSYCTSFSNIAVNPADPADFLHKGQVLDFWRELPKLYIETLPLQFKQLYPTMFILVHLLMLYYAFHHIFKIEEFAD